MGSVDDDGGDVGILVLGLETFQLALVVALEEVDALDGEADGASAVARGWYTSL